MCSASIVVVSRGSSAIVTLTPSRSFLIPVACDRNLLSCSAMPASVCSTSSLYRASLNCLPSTLGATMLPTFRSAAPDVGSSSSG